MFKGFDRSIWIRFWGVTLLNIGNFMIRPFMALYLASDLGAALSLIGIVLTVRPIGSFVGGMLGGYYADKWGRKPVMIIGLTFDALSLLGYAWTHDVLWFAICSFGQGISASFAEPATNAMIADVTTSENRARAYSLLYMGVNVGAAVGPLLAVNLILHHPQLLFTVMASMTLAYALVVYLFIPETKPEDCGCVSEECKRNQGKMGYGFVLRDSKLMFYLLGAISISLGTLQMSSYMPLHLQHVLPQAAVWLYGAMMSVNGVLCVFLAMPVAKWLSRYNPYNVIKFGGAVYAAGMFILALNQSAWMMLAGYSVFTFGEIICASVQQKILADFAPDDMRARYMSVGSISWILSATIAPVAGGSLMQHFGGHVMLLVFALVMSASILFYRLLKIARLRELGKKQSAESEDKQNRLLPPSSGSMKKRLLPH